jgi:hypothetical protein
MRLASRFSAWDQGRAGSARSKLAGSHEHEQRLCGAIAGVLKLAHAGEPRDSVNLHRFIHACIAPGLHKRAGRATLDSAQAADAPAAECWWLLLGTVACSAVPGDLVRRCEDDRTFLCTWW